MSYAAKARIRREHAARTVAEKFAVLDRLRELRALRGARGCGNVGARPQKCSDATRITSHGVTT